MSFKVGILANTLFQQLFQDEKTTIIILHKASLRSQDDSRPILYSNSQLITDPEGFRWPVCPNLTLNPKCTSALPHIIE